MGGEEAWSWSVDSKEDPLEALKEQMNDLINEYESLASEVEAYE